MPIHIPENNNTLVKHLIYVTIVTYNPSVLL